MVTSCLQGEILSQVYCVHSPQNLLCYDAGRLDCCIDIQLAHNFVEVHPVGWTEVVKGEER